MILETLAAANHSAPPIIVNLPPTDRWLFFWTIVGAVAAGLAAFFSGWGAWLARSELKEVVKQGKILEKQDTHGAAQIEIMQQQADLVNKQLEQRAILEVLAPQDAIRVQIFNKGSIRARWGMTLQVFNSGKRTARECRVTIYVPMHLDIVDPNQSNQFSYAEGRWMGRDWRRLQRLAGPIYVGEALDVMTFAIQGDAGKHRISWVIDSDDGRTPAEGSTETEFGLALPS
jgi:hypothetical protein